MNRVRIFFKRALRWYVFTFPSILIFSALVILWYLGYSKFFGKGDFASVLNIYTTIVALGVAFSAICFQYAKLAERSFSSKLVTIGEEFLYGSLTMVLALLVSWLSFETNKVLENIMYFNYIEYLTIIFFSFGQLYLYYSAMGFHSALTGLEGILFNKLIGIIKKW